MAKLSVLPYQSLRNVGVPYSRVHIDRLEKAGKFPERVRLGAARVAWIVSEIEEWLASRPRGIGPARVRRGADSDSSGTG